MAKIVKMVNWTSPKSGKQVEVLIAVEKRMVEKVIYADGWNIPDGAEVYTGKTITVSVDGKYLDRAMNNPNRVEENENGVYARIGYKGMINKEQFELVMVAIEEAEAELKEAFKIEYPEEVKTMEEAKAKEIENEKAREIDWAKKTIEKAAKQSEILSSKQEEIWRRNYNNIENEGGEGYVPDRITKEILERARKVLEND